MADGVDAGGQEFEGAGHAADGVVDGGRAVERNDDIVCVGGDVCGVSCEQQATGQDGDSDAARAEHAAETEKVRVHEGFATGEDDPLNLEGRDVVEVAGEIACGKFGGVRDLPDVAHEAATIAAAVGLQDQDGKAVDHVNTRLPARRRSGPR
jgi:hypothetical protein